MKTCEGQGKKGRERRVGRQPDHKDQRIEDKFSDNGARGCLILALSYSAFQEINLETKKRRRGKVSELISQKAEVADIVIDHEVCQDDEGDAPPVDNLSHDPHECFPNCVICSNPAPSTFSLAIGI